MQTLIFSINIYLHDKYYILNYCLGQKDSTGFITLVKAWWTLVLISSTFLRFSRTTKHRTRSKPRAQMDYPPNYLLECYLKMTL